MSALAKVKQYVRANNKQLAIAFLLGMAIASSIILILVYFYPSLLTKTGVKSSFGNPDYQKELSLFKNLKRQEQEEYLDLSRESKIAKYGNRLI